MYSSGVVGAEEHAEEKREVAGSGFAPKRGIGEPSGGWGASEKKGSRSDEEPAKGLFGSQGLEWWGTGR